LISKTADLLQHPLSTLQPASIWQHFWALTQIPRPSGNEGKIRQHVEAWADDHHFKTITDKKGNLLVEVPPTLGKDSEKASGRSPAAKLILQAHLDMVCERNPDCQRDPALDPLEIYVDNGWVKARGTTLGADNGIGVAAAMAIADDAQFKRGPLRLLFTVEEETGLHGARELDVEFLKGEALINLDGDIDALVSACAGTFNCQVSLPIRRQDLPIGKTGVLCKLSIGGLKGGHSGNDIHESRGNAIKLLASLVTEFLETTSLQIVAIDGGRSANAIPRQAEFIVLIDEAKIAPLKTMLDAKVTQWREHPDEPGLILELEKISHSHSSVANEPPLVLADQQRMLQLLLALPNGPLEFSAIRIGHPETSNNLGVVETTSDQINITLKARSRLLDSLNGVRLQIVSIAQLAEATFREVSFSPPWSGKTKNRLIDSCTQLSTKLLGKTPQTKVIHGVIECGYFSAKAPNLEMLSIGPNMEECHSPNERLEIASVSDFYRILEALVNQWS
jgi:dipeptidase D